MCKLRVYWGFDRMTYGVRDWQNVWQFVGCRDRVSLLWRKFFNLGETNRNVWGLWVLITVEQRFFLRRHLKILNLFTQRPQSNWCQMRPILIEMSHSSSLNKHHDTVLPKWQIKLLWYYLLAMFTRTYTQPYPHTCQRNRLWRLTLVCSMTWPCMCERKSQRENRNHITRTWPHVSAGPD